MEEVDIEGIPWVNNGKKQTQNPEEHVVSMNYLPKSAERVVESLPPVEVITMQSILEDIEWCRKQDYEYAISNMFRYPTGYPPVKKVLADNLTENIILDHLRAIYPYAKVFTIKDPGVLWVVGVEFPENRSAKLAVETKEYCCLL